VTPFWRRCGRRAGKFPARSGKRGAPDGKWLRKTTSRLCITFGRPVETAGRRLAEMPTRCGYRIPQIHSPGTLLNGGHLRKNGAAMKDGPGGATNAVTLALPPSGRRSHMSTPRTRACHPPGTGQALDLLPSQVAGLASMFDRPRSHGDTDECWPWVGPRSEDGYGVIYRRLRGRRGNSVYAHRVAWVLATGRPLTDHLTIDHLCGNAWCVNANHLEPVSHSENARRMASIRYPDRHEMCPGNPKRRICPICRVAYGRGYLTAHIRRVHPDEAV
jgi:hypothetical protein